jgi:Sec-independent protein translocase protein TatA
LPIEGVEWVVVLGVVLAMLLWSPERIPEIARSVGRFVREMQKARSEVNSYVSEALKPGIEGLESTDRQLIEAARKLGIVTEGMRRDEIIAMINKALGGGQDAPK